MDFLWTSLKFFDLFDLAVFSANFLIFVFSKKIVTFYPKSRDETSLQKRLWALRSINLVLFLLYLAAFLFVQKDSVGLVQKISATALTLLTTYLLLHIFQYFTLKRYGRLKRIQDETVLSETYQSEIFNLLALLAGGISAFLIFVNIWEITDWLKATSVLGGLLIIAFSTKDIWGPDNIHGLIILYNGDIEPGSVVRVPALDLLAVVIQTSMTQTVFRDLRQRHQILLPNSLFRQNKIEVLSNCPEKGIDQFIDFNIGYGVRSARVELFFQKVWETACKFESTINTAKKPRVVLLNNGDHAVCWRFFYTVKNIYRILPASFAVNRAAYDLSLEWGLDLSTPITHLRVEPASPPA